MFALPSIAEVREHLQLENDQSDLLSESFTVRLQGATVLRAEYSIDNLLVLVSVMVQLLRNLADGSVTLESVSPETGKLGFEIFPMSVDESSSATVLDHYIGLLFSISETDRSSIQKLFEGREIILGHMEDIDRSKAALNLRKRLNETVLATVEEILRSMAKKRAGTDPDLYGGLSIRLTEDWQKTRHAINVERLWQSWLRPGKGGRLDHPLIRLNDRYAEVHSQWNDAKKIYRRNSSNKWPAFVAAQYPHFPEDLIEWLGCNTPTSDLGRSLSPEISDKMLLGEAQGLTSQPSDIALEHAARLCGAGPHCLTVRQLRSIRSTQNKETKKRGSTIGPR